MVRNKDKIKQHFLSFIPPPLHWLNFIPNSSTATLQVAEGDG